MKQKFTTGMLFISAVVLGAFIWFVERDSATSSQQQKIDRTLFSVYPETIDWIAMERGDVQIECSKVSGEWRLSKPADAPVNTTVVERMIAGMASVERGELITAETLHERGLTPADYGFDEPRARIRFRNNYGTFTWLIGRDAPLGEMLYVMSSDGEDIIAVPKTLLNLVPEDPAWIRDRTLFTSRAGAVRGIDLRRPSGFLQLRQTAETGWIMQQPHEGPSDRLSVNTLIEKILSARIGKFIADEQTDLTIYGLEDPAIELTLFAEDGGTQTLRIGKTLPDQPEMRYAKWIDSYSVFTVPSEWAAALELKSDSLRNRQLASGGLAKISRLTVTSGENLTELIRTNGQWQVVRPARWEAEPAAVNRVLEAIAGSVIMEFVDTPDTNQTAQIINAPLMIRFGAEENLNGLRISDPLADGSRLVQRNEEPSFGIIAGELFDTVFRDPLFYRTRTVLQIDPAEIKAVTLTAADGEFRVEKANGQYAATDRTQKADSTALFELTAELTGLRAERYVAFNPESLNAYGLGNPAARLSITLNSTNVLGQVLLLGDAAEDGRYAMLQGQPIVFVLPERSAKALTQELTQPLEKQTEETAQP
jgi:hypothetical protein